jgi:hypothetical protein
VKVSKQKARAFALLIFATLAGDARGQNQFDTVSAEESNPLLVRVQQLKDGKPKG